MAQLPRPVYVRAQTLAAGSYFAAHQHDWIQFLYAISGMLRITLPTGSFTVPPRYAVWIPAGVVHQVSAQGEVTSCTSSPTAVAGDFSPPTSSHGVIRCSLKNLGVGAIYLGVHR